MYFSLLDASKILSVKHKRRVDHQAIRRLYTTGVIAEPPKVGQNRVLVQEDIDRIEQILLERWAAR